MLQLDAKDRSLQGVQTAVEAELLVMILAASSMDPKHAHMLGQVVIIGGHHAAVAIGTEVLGGKEAETPDVPHATRLVSFVSGPEGLSTILHYLETVLTRKLEQRVHVTTLPIQVYRDDSFDRRRTGRFKVPAHAPWVKVEGARVDVTEHRRCSKAHDATGRSKEAEWSRDDLVAGRNAEGYERKQQCVGARRDAYGVPDVQTGSDLMLKGIDLLAQDEVAALKDTVDRLVDLIFDFVVFSDRICLFSMTFTSFPPGSPAAGPLGHSGRRVLDYRPR